MPFHSYILKCNDGSYYTGHTDNLETRTAAHKTGTIAGYTAERLPVELVWSEEFPTREEALASERRIKGWGRAKKEALIRGDWEEIKRLAQNRQGG
jgi:putative endonuclease